ncbi:MAG: DegT/DnrJ/EryC1/StrS aminotransferase family protein [Chitinophagaceae bacterium]|nr:MAG: DegT/DnrJ/EryC1/StrS aminotransferase family protein [Chitinophagaceae bacterium]
MEAFSTLMRGYLPPVGRPIVYSTNKNNSVVPGFDNYDSCYVDSGTSALALALLHAKYLQPDIELPEVIVPGYCCPDLLSAAHYAGFKPVLVDINADDPCFNLNALKRAITKNTTAVIAINFLGVAENLKELLALKNDFPNVRIIEDNAQWFPSVHENELLMGDYVTFSFGRGKPVSLLGGGALLTKKPISKIFFDLHVKKTPNANLSSKISLRCKYFLYNRLLTPFLYQFLARNPFFSLGKTQYHRLDVITDVDSQRLNLLLNNANSYAESDTQIECYYDKLFEDIGFHNNFTSLTTQRRRRLLRYPVLFSSVEQKNKVFSKLIELGLGATEMYKTDLPAVDGVNQLSVRGSLEAATSFASRFITLPVHNGVTKKHLKLVQDAFEKAI